MFKLYEEKVLIRTFTKKITSVAKEMDAEIILAHTPYRVGYPAFLASRKLGTPCSRSEVYGRILQLPMEDGGRMGSFTRDSGARKHF